MLVAAILFSFSQKGKIERDKKELELVFECSKYIPAGTTISIDKETFPKWELHAYFARYQYISLDCNNTHLFYLHNRDLPLPPFVEESVPLINTDDFTLFSVPPLPYSPPHPLD